MKNIRKVLCKVLCLEETGQKISSQDIANAFLEIGKREARIVRLKLGLGSKPKTLNEISKQIGLSRERVRQLKDRGLSRLVRALQMKLSGVLDKPVLDRPIETLKLDARAHNGLKCLGIRTIGELVQKSANELLCARGFGPDSLKNIESRLKRVGLSIARRV